MTTAGFPIAVAGWAVGLDFTTGSGGTDVMVAPASDRVSEELLEMLSLHTAGWATDLALPPPCEIRPSD